MASILNSKATFYQRDPIGNNECGEPLQSEADLYIKTLARKQCDTDFTLEHCLKNEKQFESTCVYKSTIQQTTGMKSHDEFQLLIENVEEKIEHNNEQKNAPTRSVGRHIKELALAVKPNSLETKLLQFAIDCNAIGEISNTCNHPAEHPINQLEQIENELFGHLKYSNEPRKTAKTILRKRKQLLFALEKPVTKPSIAPNFASASKNDSLWDITEPVNTLPEKPKMYTCGMPPRQLFTIQDGKIVPLRNESEPRISNLHSEQSGSFVGVDNLVGLNREREKKNEQKEYQRLDEQQIKELSKFQNYDKGSPSKVLYLKNLASSITENDLISLFSKYQNYQSNQFRINYKLMRKGKMRGQAFVKFHSLEAAVKAMDEVNGVILHNKPVIIQFSKCRQ